MKTLLHCCCAPCANMCIDTLREEGREVTGFWYNPNIHPVTEYRARRNTLEAYAKTIDLPLVVVNEYALRPFVRAVAEDIENRCVKCYEMRLYRAAEYAAENGFDSFTSSLFISPYQKHDLLRQVAQAAGEAYHVE
ncbi:MAG: epoxyqueuosine reductase QueH, partial [Clostridiales bacterium]|nr:epoxyqueuosine reductase QueH [Clostridiales bacterium]